MASIIQRPHEHFCPISHGVMKDPVVAADGHTYERSQIERWLSQKSISPVTNLPMGTKLVSNTTLRKLIEDHGANSSKGSSVPVAPVVARAHAAYSEQAAPDVVPE